MEFKVDYWQIKLIYTFTQFETLGDMINNDAAVSSYLRNVTDKVKDYNISMGREWTGVVDPEIKRTYTNEVNGAFSHYSSMMIVTVATYIEAMVSEFFVALFLSRPAAMHNYLNPGEADSKAGRVSLKDILRQNSLDSL
ncbi:hypothetical protein P3710_28325, partial [Vibrio parahaemolyticus]|nr:hypothetical protein [Vibrio parahaemolyticus]